MRKIVLAAGLAVLVANPALAGSYSHCEAKAAQRKTAGTLIGAGAGALIGNAVAPKGGALIGAAGGAIVGNQMARRKCYRGHYAYAHHHHHPHHYG